MTISMHWHEAAGLLGLLAILLAYGLLQAGRLQGNALGYQLLNACGALAVLVSLLYAFNLSAFVMQAAWLAVSIYGIARGRKRSA
jgi:hypothetical protein